MLTSVTREQKGDNNSIAVYLVSLNTAVAPSILLEPCGRRAIIIEPSGLNFETMCEPAQAASACNVN